jgi:CO/xanthine dehydrogenase Mo-binding subunit
VSPLANGGAFGGKLTSPVTEAARALADQFGRTVRVVFAREDVVRIGPKRPPIAASAHHRDGTIAIEGTLVGDAAWFGAPHSPYLLDLAETWTAATVPGPATARHLRAFPLVERTLLVEGALAETNADRTTLVRDERVGAVLLDTCAADPAGAVAGARVSVDRDTGAIEHVVIRVAAGDPRDETVLRSYCIGAAHMALGLVLSEAIAVDPETGEPLDLTIRSFGVIRAKDTPPITVTIVEDPGPPLAHASDAVMAAVAAATWNAISASDGTRPETFPARHSRAARRMRR